MLKKTPYRIITFGQECLQASCRRLQREVEGAGFAPDLVVTIAKGGDMVGANMFPEVRHVSVGCHRPSAGLKARWLRVMFWIMPRWVCDSLRIMESRWRSRRTDRIPEHMRLDQRLADAIGAASRVLVVDDAVDSGATLATVIEAVRGVGGMREIKSAVLTVTMHDPLARPDFTLYDENVLIRFPWSLDS